MRHVLAAGITAAALFGATPVLAAESLGGDGCIGDLTLSGGSTLVNCYGRFDGNVLNNASNSSINDALGALGYVGPSIVYSSVAAANKLELDDAFGDAPNAPVNFPGSLLNGTIYVGIHSGGGGALGVGNSTTFYRINAVNLDSFVFDPQGISTATLIASVETPVPEPSTWAMMLLGFGIVGGAMRAVKRRQKCSVSYG